MENLNIWLTRSIISQKSLQKFDGKLASGLALKWYLAHRNDVAAQSNIEKALFDPGLRNLLANARIHWESILREHVPDEKIMASSDEWTDARINEAIKVTYAKNALEQVGAKINNGKVSFSDAATKNAAIEALKNWETPDFKLSSTGNSRLDVTDVVAPEELTPQQKLLQSFGEKLGVKTTFFRNDNADFHGAHAGNISYINVNSEMPIGKVFWHESMHWLKASNPKLYQQLVKAAGITDEQRQAYLEETEHDNLYTDEAIDEEIIADQFEDVAKRNGLLQSIAGKNRGLVERVVQWLKDTMNKFIEFFHNPQGKLTTKQAQALADEFGKIATRLVDPNGERIFRYNRRTHNLETIGGRSMAKTTPLSEVSDIKYTANNISRSETEQDANDVELPEGYRTESGRPLSQSDAREFIVRPNGSRDFGEINKEIVQAANKVLEKQQSGFRFKIAPVRLQVGIEDTGESDGFGYKHIKEHLQSIKDRGFKSIPQYVEHVLKNFNQVYKARGGENRIILYCKGDESKGFMPLDLELEKREDDFYNVITAYPRRRANKNETLLIDTRPTNVSTVAATVPHLQDSNNKNGVASQRDIVVSNVSKKYTTIGRRNQILNRQ